MRPRISVVVPTHNRVAFLREAVASVVRQTTSDWELVIVDDASTDSTPNWLQELDDKRIRSERSVENVERGAARNLGLMRARGAYVLFLDDDDRLTQRALQALAGALDREPYAVAAVGAKLGFDETGRQLRMWQPRRRVTRSLEADMLVGWWTSWVPGSGQCLFRADPLRQAGGWRKDLRVAEDQELALRMSRFGPTVVIPDLILEARFHAGQWRPTDTSTVEQAFRSAFVAELPRNEQPKAQRLLNAGDRLRVGTERYNRGAFGSALRAFLRATLCAPEILASPMTRPPLLRLSSRSLMGVLLGRRGGQVIRSIHRRRRRALQTDLTTSVETISRLSGVMPDGRKSTGDE